MSRQVIGSLSLVLVAGCTLQINDPRVAGVNVEKATVSTRVDSRVSVDTRAQATPTPRPVTQATALPVDAGPSPSAVPVPSVPAGPKLVLGDVVMYNLRTYSGAMSKESMVTFVQPGDNIAIVPMLKNVGDYDVSAPTLVPSLTDPFATVSTCFSNLSTTSTSVDYPDIAPGKQSAAWQGAGFCLDLSKDWPRGRPLVVDLLVKDGHARSWNLRLTVPVL